MGERGKPRPEGQSEEFSIATLNNLVVFIGVIPSCLAPGSVIIKGKEYCLRGCVAR